MTDAHLALLLEVASIRKTEQQAFLDFVRDECTLANPAGLQSEVNAARLARLVTKRDNEDAKRPALDQEIADLQP